MDRVDIDVDMEEEERIFQAARTAAGMGSRRAVADSEDEDVEVEDVFDALARRRMRAMIRAGDNGSPVEMSASSGSVSGSIDYRSDDDPEEYNCIKFAHWDEEKDSQKYLLWKTNDSFTKNAEEYVRLALTYGNGCYVTCFRAHGRKPTVHEFMNYFISKKVPRQSWFANWKTVNHERRGWPLQYTERAKVYVKSLNFYSALSDPVAEVKVVESQDSKYKAGQSLEICLWQLEPTSTGEDFFDGGITVYEGKVALEAVRRFYEQYHFPSDPKDFVSFFENFLYERLELIHYLENPAPSKGVLSNKDRGKIISGIKHYHYVKSTLQDVQNVSNMEGDDDASLQKNDSNYLTLKMQLDRHKVELRFLLDKTLRSLLGAMDDNTKTGSEDASIENFDYVLVMNQVAVEDLKSVYEILNTHGFRAKSCNIRIMNDLEASLKNCNANSTIFVLSGDYSISGLGRLGAGGSIIGIKVSNLDITLTPTDDIGDIWLLVSSESSETPLTLKNLNVVFEEGEDNNDPFIFVNSGTLVSNACKYRQRRRVQNGDSGDNFKMDIIRCAEGASVCFQGENAS